MQQRIPIPLPKDAAEDAAAATPSKGDSKDGDPEVSSNSTQSLADKIHALTARFDAY